MKTILSSLLICFAFILSPAQSVKGEPTASIYFQITPAGQDMAPLLGFDSFTQLALHLQKKNKKVIEIMDASYEMIEKKLSDINGFKILPANTLESKINYTKLGYPKSSFKTAAEKVDNQQLVRIDINVIGKSGGEFSVGLENDNKSAKVSREKLKPGVLIVMTFADSNGNKIAKIKGNSLNLDSEAVVLTKLSLQKNDKTIRGLKTSVEFIPYYYYLDLAIDDFIKNLKIE